MSARLEQTAQQELANLNNEKMRLEDKLRDAESRRLEALRLHRSGMIGAIEIDMLRMHASVARQEASHARTLALERARSEPRIETARQSLLKASSARKDWSIFMTLRLMSNGSGTRRSERRDELEVSMIGNQTQ